MPRINDADYIRKYLSPADLWGQLAEEAAELSQAALKMQRVELGNNPPRKSPEECRRDVVEEHADLALCFELLKWDDKVECHQIRSYKLKRWARVLRRLIGEIYG